MKIYFTQKAMLMATTLLKKTSNEHIVKTFLATLLKTLKPPSASHNT